MKGLIEVGILTLVFPSTPILHYFSTPKQSGLGFFVYFVF
jgi:hypothetical protein